MSLAIIPRHELIRKATHLSSSLIPLLYWYVLDRDIMLKGTIFLASGFLLAEYLRFHLSSGAKIFFKIFGPALRSHEQIRLTGASYLFTSSVLTIFLFPRNIAVPALLILAISDTVAALVGIPFGRHRFLVKSLEGSTAFLVATVIILWFFIPGELYLVLITSCVLTITEAFPLQVDDNFLIPLLAGLMLSIPGWL